MSGKNLDALTPAEHEAYHAGVNDTHARYEAQQAQAAEWLKATVAVIARIETHERPHSYARRVLAVELRAALSLGWVKLKCECELCAPKGGA